jgi:CheY-like chemotaxis protein
MVFFFGYNEEMTKILLAEDDLFLRDIYKEILTSANYHITTAVDGKEALKKLQEGGWDLVLLDEIMPKMTGVNVLKKLNEKNLHVYAKKIIFMTNTDEMKEFDQVKGLVDGFLLKSSFNPDELVQKVKQILGG